MEREPVFSVNQSIAVLTGRDSKTSLSATKSMSVSSSGATLSSSGKANATTGLRS